MSKINSKSKRIVAFFLILILGAFVRLWRLADYPVGFSLDEMSQGYTAYSILKTGRDEWGEFLPLAPRAFGDFRSPLYTYLCVPFIAFLGLTETAVRLPNAILGIFSVVLIYFFSKSFLKHFFDKEDFNLLPFLAMLFLAISPWHISLSRGAFEANLNTFFYCLAFWLFLKGLKENVYFFWSGLFFGLNLFSYYSPRFFTPITVVVLLIYFKKSLMKKFLWSFLPIFSFFLLLSFGTLMAGAKTRVSDTGIFNPTDKWLELAGRQYEAAYLGFPFFLERMFNNKAVFVLNQFFKNLLNYFSMEFLFSKGASEATYGMIPGRGVLYLAELPLVLLAFWQLIKKKSKSSFFLMFLLVTSLFPAALAKGERAANRAITSLPFWIFLSAYGGVKLVQWSKENFPSFNKYLLFFYSSILLLFYSFFLEDYFYHAFKNNAPSMAYGWSEVMEFTSGIEDKYDRIIISRRLSEPQIGVAFYNKWEPADFQKQSQPWLIYKEKGFLFVDQLPEYQLGKYLFKNFNFSVDLEEKRTLFIGKEEDFWGINNNRILKTIYYPGPKNNVAFEIVTF